MTSLLSIPCMGLGYWQSTRMRNKSTPRKVLSDNLRELMAQRPGLDTIKKVAEASGGTLSNGKVGRIYAASHTTDIETLQDLAAVFELEPWQLLVEGLKPEAPPRLADAAVLAQLLDALQAGIPQKGEEKGPSVTTGDAHSTNARNVKHATPAHPVETEAEPAFGSGLARAFKSGEGKKSASGKSVAVQKSRAGRRA